MRDGGLKVDAELRRRGVRATPSCDVCGDMFESSLQGVLGDSYSLELVPSTREWR